MNIFDLSGPEFLTFYFWAFLAAMGLAFGLPHLFRFPLSLPLHPPKLDPFEVAYLKGGKQAAIKAAIISLWHRNLVAIEGSGTITREFDASNAGLLPLESHLLSGMGGLIRIQRAYNLAIPEEALSQRRLNAEGLWLSPFHRETLRLVRILPPVALLVIAIIKIQLGISRGRPVDFLVIWSLVTAASAVFWFMRVPRLSWRGQRLLELLARQKAVLRFTSRRHRKDILPAEAAMSVALFGLPSQAWGYDIVVALEPPKPVHSHLTGSGCGGGSSCGGSSCGGGGGDGGGGGGGCGGCSGGGH